MEPTAYVVIIGNPLDGMQFFGPFEDAEEAAEFGDNLNTGDWWVVGLIDPETSKGD